MTRKITLLVAAIAFLSVISYAGTSTGPVTIKEVYRSQFAIGAPTALISVLVERNIDNREVTVVCESENYYRSSTEDLSATDSEAEQLANNKEKRVRTILFQYNLPPGDYLCKATLTRKINGESKKFLSLPLSLFRR